MGFGTIIFLLFVVFVVGYFYHLLQRSNSDSLIMANEALNEENIQLKRNNLFQKIDELTKKVSNFLNIAELDILETAAQIVVDEIYEEAEYLKSNFEDEFTRIKIMPSSRLNVINRKRSKDDPEKVEVTFYNSKDHINMLDIRINQLKGKIDRFLASFTYLDQESLSKISIDWFRLANEVQNSMVSSGLKPKDFRVVTKLKIKGVKGTSSNYLTGIELLANLNILELVECDIYYPEFESIRSSNSINFLILKYFKCEPLFNG